MNKSNKIDIEKEGTNKQYANLLRRLSRIIARQNNHLSDDWCDMMKACDVAADVLEKTLDVN